MLNKTRSALGSRTPGLVVLVAGLAVLAGSALWLVTTGNTDVRYSADHAGTVSMWHRWIPALVGIVLARLVPTKVASQPSARRAPHLEAVVLLAAAVAFAVAMPLAGGEPAYSVLKLTLLLGVPAAMFLALRRRGTAWAPHSVESGVESEGWRRQAPWIPVLAWLALSYAGPFAQPPSGYGRTVDPVILIVTMVVVFLINALLEEIFYRRWLQTRWEAILGRWPAIVLASLVWAAWHIAIQGSGRLPDDLAMVFVNQGVLGLFLGYLWSRYRRMWPLLVVHGAVNAAPILLGLL